MADYKRMYILLSRAAEYAVRLLEKGDIKHTIFTLKLAQLQCENIYIESDNRLCFPNRVSSDCQNTNFEGIRVGVRFSLLLPPGGSCRVFGSLICTNGFGEMLGEPRKRD